MTAPDNDLSTATTVVARPRRRLSARTAGLLAVAAATGSLGFAAAASASSPAPFDSTTGELETSVVERSKGAVIDVIVGTFGNNDDGSFDDCPACGMG